MLTENEAKFVWKEEHQGLFDELKQALISSLILAFPKIEGEYNLNVIDISNQEIGADLLQKQERQRKNDYIF